MAEQPRVGEMIVYRTFSGMWRSVKVTAVYEVVKNGSPGFDGVDRDGNSFWGYNDQIIPEEDAYAWIVRANAP